MIYLNTFGSLYSINNQNSKINWFSNFKESLDLNSSEHPLSWAQIEKDHPYIKPGHRIAQSPLLFRKIEDTEMEAQREKLAQTKIDNQPMEQINNPQKELINFDDFTKMDLRVGTILSAEKMPKANKLLVLKVDVGIDQRTIVSGIAEHFTPEEVVGKQVCVLINLAPRAIRGTESQGMILMAEDTDGSLRFVTPDQATAAGSSIR